MQQKNGHSDRGGYKIFHFSLEVKKRRYVKDMGDRLRCVDQVFVEEITSI